MAFLKLSQIIPAIWVMLWLFLFAANAAPLSLGGVSLVDPVIDAGLSALPSDHPEYGYGLLPIEGSDPHPLANQMFDSLWQIPEPKIRAELSGLKVEGLFSIPAEYFAYTVENLEASQWAAWYANWTIDAQEDPAWKEIGEQRLFGRHFANTDNFECGLGFTGCQGKASLTDLLASYPGDIETARRVYFAQMSFSNFHDLHKASENGIQMAHAAVSSLVPSIVKRFMFQGDSHADFECRIREYFMDVFLNLVQQVATKLIASYGGVMVSPSVEGIPGAVGKMAAKMAIEFVIANLGSELNRANGLLNEHKKLTRPYLRGGLGRDGICGDIGSDFKPDNDGNMHRLQEYAHTAFRTARNKMRSAIGTLNHGYIPTPGEPSLMAYVFLAKKWAGESSVVETLRNTMPMEFDMERQIVMEVVSIVLASNYNYLKCAHHPEAEKLAAAAETAKHHKDGWKKGQYTHLRSYFRPEPEADPKMLCQAVRMHMATIKNHEASMAAWDNVADFAGNRYELKWDSLLQEAWANYKRMRNVPGITVGELMAGRVGTGFYMATCVNDHLKLSDYMSRNMFRRDHWNFPFICGDWRASETRDFLKLINAGPGGETRQDKGPEHLWTDRLPRSLRKLSPISNYLTVCEVGVSFPQFGDTKWPHRFYRVNFKQSDKDCNLIREATAGMDEWNANDWFCRRPSEHTVFKRERSHIDTPGVPTVRIASHRGMCAGWTKNNRFHPRDLVEDGSGSSTG